MDLFQAIFLAIIEGITEFLPISSTGHMAIASAFMGINKLPFAKLFMIVIQFGAILSVVVLYWRKFLNFKSFYFYVKLFVAILPAMVFGVFLKDHIENVLEKPLVIALVLLGGGVVLLFVDKWFRNPTIHKEEEITIKNSFVVGLFQVLAIVLPGLSRSAATIIGGMQQKMSRQVAAEFSFYLAVPTMLAATVKSLFDMHTDAPELLTFQNLEFLLIGSVVAFVIAILAIRFLITFLQKNGFRFFGWYRIFVGVILLILIATGFIES